MIKQLITLALFCSIAFLNGHIRFLNTTNQNLFIVDVQLKRSYKVEQNNETLLITTAQASHFLIYKDPEQTSNNQTEETPLFSFGIAEHALLHSIPTISPENLLQSDLPEPLFIIPSLIKRTQAVNLITKPIKQCSKCEERRKERQAAAEAAKNNQAINQKVS